MARKTTTTNRKPDANQFTTAAPTKATERAAVTGLAVSTPVRNTPIPKPVAAAVRPPVTQDAIARKAFEIYVTGNGGSPLDHWLAAERTLRAA